MSPKRSSTFTIYTLPLWVRRQYGLYQRTGIRHSPWFSWLLQQPLLFGRSGLQLRARIQLGFVEAFSTTLGFSQRLSQTAAISNIQLWISCFVFTTISHCSWISSGSSLRGFGFLLPRCTLFSLFSLQGGLWLLHSLSRSFGLLLPGWLSSLQGSWLMTHLLSRKKYIYSKMGGSSWGLGFKGFLCSRPFVAGDGHAWQLQTTWALEVFVFSPKPKPTRWLLLLWSLSSRWQQFCHSERKMCIWWQSVPFSQKPNINLCYQVQANFGRVPSQSVHTSWQNTALKSTNSRAAHRPSGTLKQVY